MRFISLPVHYRSALSLGGVQYLRLPTMYCIIAADCYLVKCWGSPGAGKVKATLKWYGAREFEVVDRASTLEVEELC